MHFCCTTTEPSGGQDWNYSFSENHLTFSPTHSGPYTKFTRTAKRPVYMLVPLSLVLGPSARQILDPPLTENFNMKDPQHDHQR